VAAAGHWRPWAASSILTTVSGQPLQRYAWLSIAAAVSTLTLKTAAYFLTGSVGLLSDAAESIVNLAGGVMALAMLTVAARPADEGHSYGHSKAEYFSSGVEGTLILVAALAIAVAAVPRLLVPRPIDQVGAGLIVSAGASVINLAAALVLLRAGRRRHSITLEANARHLLTDVWTSAGVIAGVGAVSATGYLRLDPLVALVVAANITWTGGSIVRRSVLGLMDTSLPPGELEAVRAVLDSRAGDGVEYHALRTRQSGARRFVSFHVLVPGTWTVSRGHHLLEEIEAGVRAAVPDATVFTHLEPLDDPASWEDVQLDRRQLAGERSNEP
jgi:cation diffusion facilitator family transporter